MENKKDITVNALSISAEYIFCACIYFSVPNIKKYKHLFKDLATQICLQTFFILSLFIIPSLPISFNFNQFIDMRYALNAGQ